MRTWRGKTLAMLATTSLVLLGSIAIPAASSAAQPSLFAAWESDSGSSTYTVAGAANIADAVAADDGAFVQLDVNGWVTMAFPPGLYAIPDGTSAPDLTIHTYDALYPADAEVSIFVSTGSTWVSAGVFPDTADVAIDLDAVVGVGPAHEVMIDQGANYIDPAYPHLGFDLNAVSAESYAPLHTSGTWEQYPTGDAFYQASVQQPINTANTSNWSSKGKGGIPVMFKLQQGTSAAVFQSIFSDDPTDVYTGVGPCGYGTAAKNLNDCAYASFVPDSTLKFRDLNDLTATYQFTDGDCYGGALRWSMAVDVDNNGTRDGSFWLNYGNAGAFNTCMGAFDQSGTNMMTLTDGRWDVTVGGWSYGNTLAQVRALYNNASVLRASLVLDGGWGANGDQILAAGTTATVNGNVYTWQADGSPLADTCSLPPATIQVAKGDIVADGDINELPVQGSLTDTGTAFRVVDCKYQYILSIPSLQGSGTYRVLIKIGGASVPTPSSPGGMVKFDLK